MTKKIPTKILKIISCFILVLSLVNAIAQTAEAFSLSSSFLFSKVIPAYTQLLLFTWLFFRLRKLDSRKSQ